MSVSLLSGCGGEGGIPDRFPPETVRQFTAAQDEGKMTLTWINPDDADFSGVLIRRSTTDYPKNPTAQQTTNDKIVYNGAGTSFTDENLLNGATYYYTAFAYDDIPNYSYGVSASETGYYKPFTLIALPDTQYYSESYPTLFTTITQWIVDNKSEKNIVFVLHEGDITDDNTEDQWTNASSSMGVLDGVVPYALSIGNHDIGANRNTTLFNKYFPVSRYQNLPTFGGIYETDKLDNSFHFFSAGGTGWLVISLEYNPRDEVMEWANQVAADNPDRRIIVLTHAYLYGNERSSIGEDIWNKFVRLHSNIIFVFNGHYQTDSSGGRLVSTGDNGNKVYQMFSDYQWEYFGGLGYVRVVEIDTLERKVTVKTYSTWMQTYKDDPDNQFEFDDVDMTPPLAAEE
ncbi:MAG: metallophosphoesterase [bacterium]